jgi:hypothetical protein
LARAKDKERPHRQIIRDLKNWGLEIYDVTNRGHVPTLLAIYRAWPVWIALHVEPEAVWLRTYVHHFGVIRGDVAIAKTTREVKLLLTQKQYLDPEQRERLRLLVEQRPQPFYTQQETTETISYCADSSFSG